MKVFLDTNVFMEYFSCRKQYKLVRDIFDFIEDGKIEAVVSVGGMYTTAYLLTRLFKEQGVHRPEQTEKLRFGLNGLLRLATIVDCNQEAIEKAINDDRFVDIEDSFQYQCALQNDCDVLLTINIKDFKNVLEGKMPILTPEEFIARYICAQKDKSSFLP